MFYEYHWSCLNQEKAENQKRKEKKSKENSKIKKKGRKKEEKKADSDDDKDGLGSHGRHLGGSYVLGSQIPSIGWQVGHNSQFVFYNLSYMLVVLICCLKVFIWVPLMLL